MLYFVGDIHGDLDDLYREMKRVNFNKESDTLVCCGDLVDRGTKNEEVVDLIECDWFVPVRGNHDQFIIDSVYNDGWFDKHFHTKHGGEWFYELHEDKQKELADKLSSVPFIMVVEYKDIRFGVAHGEVPLFYYKWEHFEDDVNSENMVAINGALWGRHIISAPLSAPILEDIDFVVHGHNGVNNPTIINNRVFLDTKDYKGLITIVSAHEIIEFAKEQSLKEIINVN